MSGYNPESQATMRLGLDHWVLFVLSSTHVIMLSVPYLDQGISPRLTSYECASRGALLLFQEHHPVGQLETEGSPDTRGTHTGCHIPRTVNQPYFSVTQITVNGSHIRTTKLMSSEDGKSKVSAKRAKALKTDCVPLKQLWRMCDASAFDPVVSDRSLRLHVLSGEARVDMASTEMKGFRSIFSFHQVYSP